jgi:HNH endonuclease
MEKEQLHRTLACLLPGRHRSDKRMVIHALIELGAVVELECSYENCLLETRQFSPTHRGEGRQNKSGITVDHIIPLWAGGSDRPDNLRVMHWICNVSFGTMWGRSHPEVRRRASEGLSRRWQDPGYRSKMANRIRSEDERDKRSSSMKALWATEKHQVTGKAAAQKAWATRRLNEQQVSCDDCGRGPFKGESGLKIHRRKCSGGLRS